MMKKKQSIIALVLAAIVTVLLGWTMIKGWGPTGTGSMKNINLGLDLSGGVSITYQAVKDNPTDEEMSDTRYKLEQRAQQYSEEAQVYLQGDNRITIEIPGATDATTILEEMGKPGSLYFIKQTNDDGTENYKSNRERRSAENDRRRKTEICRRNPGSLQCRKEHRYLL